LSYLIKKNRKVPIKTSSFLIPLSCVANIYANDALFKVGILPTALACNISESRFDQLTDIIKTVLTAAIAQGGTTLKDFTQADGRAGNKCKTCETVLEEVRQSNRSSIFFPCCQTQ
jgi:formamidopyrimidine-DNA glycosylase